MRRRIALAVSAWTGHEAGCPQMSWMPCERAAYAVLEAIAPTDEDVERVAEAIAGQDDHQCDDVADAMQRMGGDYRAMARAALDAYLEGKP